MKEKKKSDLAVLLRFTGSYKGLTFLGLGLSAVAIVLGMLPYICIWLVARDLIAVAPNWTEAVDIARYGWMAFGFAVAGIVVYFAALMCTHLAAFRTASNIRKAGMKHLMKTPLGFFDSNASGLLRNRLDGAASETETLLAHNPSPTVCVLWKRRIKLLFFRMARWPKKEARQNSLQKKTAFSDA